MWLRALKTRAEEHDWRLVSMTRLWIISEGLGLRLRLWRPRFFVPEAVCCTFRARIGRSALSTTL